MGMVLWVGKSYADECRKDYILKQKEPAIQYQGAAKLDILKACKWGKLHVRKLCLRVRAQR